MEKILHNVADLPAEARSAVEGLIGHRLGDQQRLYIIALDATSEPDRSQRTNAWEEIQLILDQSATNVARSGMSEDAVESIIDAECERVRYGS